MITHILNYYFKSMEKSLAVAREAELKAFSGLEYTGHDLGQSSIYPSIVNVLQSDKQFKAFGDEANNITMGMYGKLFIRTEKNKISDLVDTIDATLLKVERGWEAKDSDGMLAESGIGFLDVKGKDLLRAKYGDLPKNMVKLLIAPYDFKTTMEMLKKVQDKISSGVPVVKSDYPFAVAVVKGNSFGTWFDCENEMRVIAQQEFNMPISKVPTVAFRVKLASEKMEGDRGDYYVLDFMVEPNDAKESAQFVTLLPEIKEQSLFYKVKERIAYEDEAPKTLEDIAKEDSSDSYKARGEKLISTDQIAADFESIDAKKTASDNEELEDLPF